MDIKSIRELIKFNSELGVYDLTEPLFLWRDDLPTNIYRVKQEQEMRIDLVVKDAYNLTDRQVEFFFNEIDIILFINNIDNPLNIYPGQELILPLKENFAFYRNDVSKSEGTDTSVRDKVILPNKKTKKDKDRELYKENNYSLPPVILNDPKPPVRISDGKLYIGGV